MSDQAPGADLPSGLRLGTVMGAPVLLKTSWFLVAALVTISFAPRVRDELPEAGDAALLIALTYALLLLFSVFLHEVAHAVAARAVGTPPTHIVLDLWGGHTAFAEEVPRPGHSILVAVVGPATNAALAVVAWLCLPVVPTGGVTELLVRALMWANLLVAVFNALPGLPLDGGRALEGVIWAATGRRETGTLAAGWIGRAVAVALVLWALVVPFALGGQPSLTSAIWLLLIAGLLWQGASQAIALARWRRRAPSLTVAGLVRPAVTVPAGATTADAVSLAREAGVADVVLLDVYGRPAGLLDSAAAASVPPERAGSVPVSAVARAIAPDAAVPHALVGEDLIAYLQRTPHPEYVVLDPGGGVVGVLAWGDVARSVAAR